MNGKGKSMNLDAHDRVLGGISRANGWLLFVLLADYASLLDRALPRVLALVSLYEHKFSALAEQPLQ